MRTQAAAASFRCLKPLPRGGARRGLVREFGTKLEVPQGTMKKLLYHMRQRYRWLLRDEVAQTVENPADIEDELRHLCGVLTASAEQAR